MKYVVTDAFTKVSETTGTIQNASRSNLVEISNSSVKGSGIVLEPYEKFTYSNKTIYARCADGKGAQVFVVPFEAAVLRGGDAVDAISANAFQSLQTTGSTVNFRNGSGTVVDSFSFADIAFIGSASSTVEGAFWLED